ncbi:MAG: AMP-binding protein [Actinomycetota bacterium]|nr:AMP-binding protein [Actinomycetota bacterium]
MPESSALPSIDLGPPAEGFATLVDVLRWRACERPERRTCTFLVDGEEREDSITDGDLDARARAIASALGERGLCRERILLLYPPGLELVAALMGVLYAGCVAVLAQPPEPGRPARTLPRLLSIADDARPGALLTTSALATHHADAFADVAALAALPRFTTDDVDPAGASAWRDTGTQPDDLALLQYTSGSTGAPQGVMVTHANLIHNLGCIRHFFDATPESHAVIWLPPYHDMGLISGIFEWFYVGATVTLMSPGAFLHRPGRWLRAVSRTRATHSGAPNFAYDLCVRKVTAAELDGVDLGSWHVAWNGAEPVRRETLARFAEAFRGHGFQERALSPCYGLGESTLIVSGSHRAGVPAPASTGPGSGSDADGRVTGEVVSCGRPVGDEIIIVDPEYRTPCAPGETGEVWVTGPSVALGYWNQPEASDLTFRAALADGRGPFLRTGDLGFLRAGELYICGRLKDLIIIRGRNVHPHDVERSVGEAHSALRPDGAAFAIDGTDGERLVVVQEIDPDRAGEPAEVIGAIRRAVATNHDLHPAAVALVEPRSIPKTTSGKVQRRETRNAYRAGALPVVADWIEGTAPTTAATAAWAHGGRAVSRRGVEDWLVSELSRRTGVESRRIDVGEPFASYGLDSAESVVMVRDVEAALGTGLSETLLWDHPTIAALAEHLAAIAAAHHADRPSAEA